MKKTLLLTSIATCTMLFQACEKQSWSETKMFHDVPKRVIDEKAPAKSAESQPAAATPADKPAP